MINEELTDLDRVELTKLSYEALNVGETVVVAGQKDRATDPGRLRQGRDAGFFEPDRVDSQLLEVSPESAS